MDFIFLFGNTTELFFSFLIFFRTWKTRKPFRAQLVSRTDRADPREHDFLRENREVSRRPSSSSNRRWLPKTHWPSSAQFASSPCIAAPCCILRDVIAHPRPPAATEATPSAVLPPLHPLALRSSRLGSARFGSELTLSTSSLSDREKTVPREPRNRRSRELTTVRSKISIDQPRLLFHVHRLLF